MVKINSEISDDAGNGRNGNGDTTHAEMVAKGQPSSERPSGRKGWNSPCPIEPTDQAEPLDDKALGMAAKAQVMASIQNKIAALQRQLLLERDKVQAERAEFLKGVEACNALLGEEGSAPPQKVRRRRIRRPRCGEFGEGVQRVLAATERELALKEITKRLRLKPQDVRTVNMVCCRLAKLKLIKRHCRGFYKRK